VSNFAQTRGSQLCKAIGQRGQTELKPERCLDVSSSTFRVFF